MRHAALRTPRIPPGWGPGARRSRGVTARSGISSRAKELEAVGAKGGELSKGFEGT